MSIIALDFGQKKIGVAISYFLQLAKPLRVYPRKEFVNNILEIFKTQNVTTVIIGLPEGKVRNKVYKFGNLIKEKCGIIPEYIDEAFTSQEAQSELITTRTRRKNRKKLEDAFAACLILEKYFNEKKYEKLAN